MVDMISSVPASLVSRACVMFIEVAIVHSPRISFSESMPRGADCSATRLTFLALRSDSLPELFVPLEQIGDQTLEPKHLFFEQ